MTTALPNAVPGSKSAEQMPAVRHSAQVMIMEDEPLVALELRILVEDMGHRVCAVVDTEADAVRQADATAPDLVIADIQLRQGNGVDAMERIAQCRDVPVIFVSGNHTFTPNPQIRTARFIAKPFRVESLRQAVADLFGGVA
ncbi:response regulator [Skermanella mucosa]|uniref:response regulator n=1 Tax=Skermanella mucosa TaxID=1789672 RepID=UPI001E379E81|nr:response regulator [Skermanella mucosa]UEM24072.1 response regulator [Skermanella mucosa]